MTDDSKPIRDRPDKTTDHECRQALLGSEIRDVHHITTYDDDRVPRDTLYLVRADGSAVEIEAERLYFDLIPDYEALLDAIRIEVVRTPRRRGTNHHGYPGSGRAWA